MRKAGVLMPISSLPSNWGIGTLGGTAISFLDFLKQAGQTYWQVLPIGPTGYGDSPYQSFSAFAGNPYYIDLDLLSEEELLKKEEYEHINWGADARRTDYGIIYIERFNVLRIAAKRLKEQARADFEEFCKAEEDWLSDYALFMALKDSFSGKAWSLWPEELKRRDENALNKAGEELSEDIYFWKSTQYLFYKQWFSLKKAAKERGISLIGDMPIYVSEDSSDVWTHPELFQMDEELRPLRVAGCPPDGFSESGQLWGNPLFNWKRMKEHGYDWWIRRIEYQFRLYDVLRIDHFRGFESYYSIPSGDKDARNGRWEPGPGMDLFNCIEQKLGKKDIIAEDLGFITEEVRKLLMDTGYPGMKVLQFGFDSRDGGGRTYQPHNYPENSVAYVGTHDNDTALGWLETAYQGDVELAREYLHLDKNEGENWGMMRAVWASPAKLAIVQMQDILDKGSEGRMNTPSTLGNNWQWRAEPGDIGEALAQRVHRQMYLYERL